CLELTAKFRVKLDDKIKRAVSSFFRWRKLRRFKSMGSYDFLWKCRIISE
ncbi:hypothetical protein ALC60_00753, partial [Trachymyrmex zeteki]